MKKFIGSVCFISALLCAAVSLMAILFTFLGPQVGIQQLLNYFTISGWIASSVFVFAFIIGFIASAIPYIRDLVSPWVRIAFGRLPWYMRMCEILLIVAAFVWFFSDGAGAGVSHMSVSQSEAYELLLKGLRRHAGMCLFLSLLSMLIAYAVVRDQPQGSKKDNPIGV
jgi:hypothetical protein